MTRFGTAALTCGLAGLLVSASVLVTAQSKPTPASPAAQQPKPETGTVKTPAKPAAGDKMVGIYIESVQRQISIDDLRRVYPGTSAARVDPGALKADAIVGWYDKGNNFHEQKMEKALGFDFGGLKVVNPVLRGIAVR
jgi:hypothetical protein